MVRDYSEFLPGAQGLAPEKRDPLIAFGWQNFFAQQLDPADLDELVPVRVVEVHRTGLRVVGDGIDKVVPPGVEATVGDWLLLKDGQEQPDRVLERKSLFRRRAPGTGREVQLIAANVDTAFVVTSCNHDFNVARLERYLALVFEAEATPVIVLTKTDLCEDVSDYMDAARAISDRAVVVALNALGDEPVQRLSGWCEPGQTVVFLGSSGVGKSTLVNALMESEQAQTAAIREDDSRGRHTTTGRHLFFTQSGCGILDTPGMRELQMADTEAGIADVFADLAELASQCKFNDCEHDSEPGCAITAAIKSGQIDAARLKRWRKLVAEERFNTASLAERRAAGKAFQKKINAVMKNKRK
ncbi:MAG: ribosome small subunit-dependent GTPase A [Silicimonas sp.]|nr:ribosome small subunit-dependent GTPase A [Silicimonas sp.]